MKVSIFIDPFIKERKGNSSLVLGGFRRKGEEKFEKFWHLSGGALALASSGQANICQHCTLIIAISITHFNRIRYLEN